MRKTREQIQQEQEACRAQLYSLLYGPNGEMMRDYLYNVLGLDQSCVGVDPHQTYYNLGKLDAIKTLINEATYHARLSK